jgi:hypothetical protein
MGCFHSNREDGSVSANTDTAPQYVNTICKTSRIPVLCNRNIFTMVRAPDDQLQGGATQAIPLRIVEERQRRRWSSAASSLWDRADFALACVARAGTYRIGYATRTGVLASAKPASAIGKIFLLHNTIFPVC